MKTFQEFQEGVKTLLGLGALGYGAYNYFKNRGEQNQEQPNSNKTKVNKNNNNNNVTDAKRGLKFLKKRKEDVEKGKTPVIFGDPEGNFRDFFDN
mgnify:CR=1 FL=1|tara:strand:- start:260 stop:544 length:285 start_codon:yes stop_codon:yes gene_type:complete